MMCSLISTKLKKREYHLRTVAYKSRFVSVNQVICLSREAETRRRTGVSVSADLDCYQREINYSVLPQINRKKVLTG